MSRADLLKVLSGEDRSAGAAALRGLLSAAELVYRAVVATRNGLFNVGLRRPVRAARPVVSVGNLTVGGTGKTPMVAEVCRRLIAMGHRPAVLLRGYRAHDGLSDEAQELRDELGEAVAVRTGADRAASARHVLAQLPGVTVFVLDDGFQHRQLARDLDLVLLDAGDPFGGGRLLPRGLLREPIASLGRAQAVILTRCAGDTSALDGKVRQFTGQPPLARTAHQWTGYRVGADTAPLDALALRPVAGVCGVAKPDSFESALRAAAGRVLGLSRFDDHYRYDSGQLVALLRDWRDRGAEAVVTTEKDWVKWRPLLADTASPLPVYRPVLRLKFLAGSEALDDLLRSRLRLRTGA